MNQTIKTALTISAAFIIGMGINNIAMSNAAPLKVAVVDVPRVVSASSEVKALRNEQQKKLQELQKWVDSVRADVAKQKTQEGKQTLAKKYDAELAKKREAANKDYAIKLRAIDQKISAQIQTKAKASGYNLVLAKGVVLMGGDDITESVMKTIK